jgi:hypothetical protein
MAISLKPINQKQITFTISGTAPMVQHQWSAKAKKMMRDKKTGVSGKTKNRDACVPEEEMQEATYLTADGEYSIPAMAFKTSLITAAHKDIGIEKTMVRKSIFIKCDDSNGNLPIECEPPIMREDMVRVGAGSADMRWRPEFREWSCEITALIDVDNLPVESLINLVNRAGFGVGLCEMRPEKGKDFGRFEVDATKPIQEGK